jgi:hypothetical protein
MQLSLAVLKRIFENSKLMMKEGELSKTEKSMLIYRNSGHVTYHVI